MGRLLPQIRKQLDHLLLVRNDPTPFGFQHRRNRRSNLTVRAAWSVVDGGPRSGVMIDGLLTLLAGEPPTATMNGWGRVPGS
ncbi:MAG TPA: hypothetical protein VI030_03390 [Propionibacteriaceae bacterium]